MLGQTIQSQLGWVFRGMRFTEDQLSAKEWEANSRGGKEAKRGPSLSLNPQGYSGPTLPLELVQPDTRALGFHAAAQPVPGQGSPGADREENISSGMAIPRHLGELPAVLGSPEKRVQAQAMGAENTEAKGGAQTDRKREWGDSVEHTQCDNVGDRDRVAPQGEGELGWGCSLANPLGTL